MSFSLTQNELTNILQDKMVVMWTAVVLAIIAAYAGAVPTNILKFIKLWYIQLVLFIAVAYVNEQSNTVGLLAAVMVIMLLMSAYNTPPSETFCGSYGNKVKGADAEYTFLPYGDIHANVVDRKQQPGYMPDIAIRATVMPVYESTYAKNSEKYAHVVNENKYTSHESEHSSKPHFETPYVADEKVQHMDDMPDMQLNDTNVGDKEYDETHMDNKVDKPSMYGNKPSMYDDKPTKYGGKPSMYDDKPTKYGDKPSMYDSKPTKYGDKSSMYDGKPTKYGEKSSMYGEKPYMYDDKSVKESTKYVSDVIDEVTNQLENDMGVKLNEYKKNEIKKEVIKKVTDMGSHKHVREYDVIRVCREIYKQRV